MADEYHDVNKYAHEGGDTAPGTREQIAARNKAADELAAAAREERDEREKLAGAASDRMKKAEEAFAEAVPDPTVVGPADSDTSSKRKSK